MQWPAQTAAGADCLAWGDRPRSLVEALADEGPVPRQPPARGADYGFGVLCRVQQAAATAH